MTITRPLQVICSSVACRRRQTVALDRVWYVDVRKGPGSHREAGWTCRFCGTENTTPPSHLPRDTILTLSSRQQVLDRISASVSRRGSAAPPAQVPIAPSGGVATPLSKQASPSGAERLGDAIAVSGPVTKPIRASAPSASPSETEVRARTGGPRRAVPLWSVGARAKAILIDALVRIVRHGGDAVAITNGRGGFEVVGVDLPDGDDVSHVRMAAFADALLEELDGIHADVVVLGGGSGDGRWQAVLHVEAGAASFV